MGATADLLLKLPDEMSFEEGAGLGVGVATTTVGLFSELGVADIKRLRYSGEGEITVDDEFVLVSGGSTATGTRAIQLLKLSVAFTIETLKPG